MKTELHLKIISTIIAFSLLFLGLYNQRPSFAETIKTLTYLITIIYFITIWMQTKRVVVFLSSMLLPIWILVLSNSGSITDFLFIKEQGKNLQQMAQVIQSDTSYKKLTTYSIFDYSLQVERQDPITYMSFPNGPILGYSTRVSSPSLIRALKQNHLIAFQLCHTSILFHINNHRRIRYYFEDSDFVYPGDKKIKPQWYQVD